MPRGDRKGAGRLDDSIGSRAPVPDTALVGVHDGSDLLRREETQL